MKKSPPRKGRKIRAAKANRSRRARPARTARLSRKTARAAARKPAAKAAGRKRAAKPAPKPVKPAVPALPPPPVIRKGLPVSKVSLRRPGRPLHMGPRPVIKSIIVYTADQKPRNDYPRRIVSPPLPSGCCTDANRLRIGKVHEELGRNYYYKRCRVCGHTVKYYFNLQSDLDSPKFRKYYEWKKSVFH